jgi:outer membrane protein
MKIRIISTVATCLALGAASTMAAEKLTGDVGMAIYHTPAIARTHDAGAVALPYLYADWGKFYARVDTFGYKLAGMGAGHLELTTRISLEGYKSTSSGIQRRGNPHPIGLGTLQETSVGAFFAYVLHDTTSGGHLLEATYAAEFKAGAITLYPQLSVERRSKNYVQHLYGISDVEAAASGLPSYKAGTSTVPAIALAADYPLGTDWGLTVQVRKKWLDSAIKSSPLVGRTSQTSGFLAVNKTFK